MSSPATWFCARGIHKSFRMGPSVLSVLRGTNLEVQQGEFVSIVGASGSGKSTLLHILGLLDQPDQGEVLLQGRNLTALPRGEHDRLRNQTFGFVFQFYHLLPELNTLENVLMPRMIRHGWLAWKRLGRQERHQAQETLQRVGLADRARHKPSQLSGGEMQRAAIARALIHRPSILLADEPTGNLDAKTGAEILALLKELNAADRLTIVLVTHDDRVARHAHRVLELSGGRLTPRT